MQQRLESFGFDCILNCTKIENRLPLLDLLLKTSHDGKVLSNQDIRNEIDTFMFEVLFRVRLNFKSCGN